MKRYVFALALLFSVLMRGQDSTRQVYCTMQAVMKLNRTWQVTFDCKDGKFAFDNLSAAANEMAAQGWVLVCAYVEPMQMGGGQHYWVFRKEERY